MAREPVKLNCVYVFVGVRECVCSHTQNQFDCATSLRARIGVRDTSKGRPHATSPCDSVRCKLDAEWHMFSHTVR